MAAECWDRPPIRGTGLNPVTSRPMGFVLFRLTRKSLCSHLTVSPTEWTPAGDSAATYAFHPM